MSKTIKKEEIHLIKDIPKKVKAMAWSMSGSFETDKIYEVYGLTWENLGGGQRFLAYILKDKNNCLCLGRCHEFEVVSN